MKTYSDRTEYSHGAIQWNNSGYLPAPGLQPNHADGPLLYFSDGQLHWLNLWERLKLALGLTDAELLQWKRRPNLSKAFGVKKPFPRVQLFYGPDYRRLESRRRLALAWGKRYGYFDRREGELVYEHWVEVTWPELIRFDWQ